MFPQGMRGKANLEKEHEIKKAGREDEV